MHDSFIEILIIEVYLFFEICYFQLIQQAGKTSFQLVREPGWNQATNRKDLIDDKTIMRILRIKSR